MNYENIERLMQRGMLDDAIVECHAVLQVHPTNARVLAYEGLCHFRREDYEAAAACLRRATILDENFVDAAIKLSQALEKLERRLEAYEVASEFLHRFPSNNLLRGIVDRLQFYLDHSRLEGWEKTVRLNTYILENVKD